MKNESSMRDVKMLRIRRGFTLLEMVVVVAILAALAGLVLPALNSTQASAQADLTQVTMANLRSGWLQLAQDVKFSSGFDYTQCRMADLFVKDGGIHVPFAAWDHNSHLGWNGPYVSANQPVANFTHPTSTLVYPDVDDKRFNGDAETFRTRNFFKSDGSDLYGHVGDPVAADTWGNPVVLQIPIAGTTFTDKSGVAHVLNSVDCWKFARVVSAGPDGKIQTDPNDPLAGRTSTGVTSRGDDIILFLNRADIYE